MAGKTDDYTGDVVVGGPHVTRVLDTVTIRKIAVGPMANNSYLLTCRSTGARLLIDPAAVPDRLLGLVREESGSARLDEIVVTHRHRDHTGALAPLVTATGAPVAAGAADADAITAETDVAVARRLHDGDEIALGDVRLDVVGLRGHTPGSVALALTDGRVHLLTGDSLFPGGPGRTATPADFASLMDDLVARVFDRYADDTWVYPGHGADTTLGRERPHLGEWRARGW